VYLARRQAGRGEGDAQAHRLAIGHEDDRGALGLPTDREDGEAASEEGVGRVGYLDFLRERWVVERGIMKGFRLIRSTTATSGTFSSVGFETVCCFD
jgi:hypothetical protein